MTSESVEITEAGFAYQLARNAEKKLDGHPLWGAQFNVTKPKAVIQTHLDLMRAGSKILYTNTYQATIEGYCKHFDFTEEQSKQLIRDTVKLALQARNTYLKENGLTREKCDFPWIAGCVGSYGAHLRDGSEYTGSFTDNVSKDILKAWHKKKINLLVDGGADIIAIVTIPCLMEAEAVAELMCEEFKHIKFYISFQCKDSLNLANGEPFSGVRKLWNYLKEHAKDNVIGIGVNCTHPNNITPLFKSVNGNVNKDQWIPLLSQPNSGETYDMEKGWIGSTVSLEDYVPEWIELGMKYVGGCCRTTPDDVPKLRKAIQKYFSEH